MQLGCACTYAISKVSENSGLAVFEARRDFRQPNIPVCKMTVPFFYLAPVTGLIAMLAMIRSCYQRHRIERCLKRIVPRVARVDFRDGAQSCPSPTRREF